MKDPKQGLSWLTLLLAALGLPAATIITNIPLVQSHVGLAVLATAGWEFLLGIFFVTREIWNDLLTRWKKRITEALDQWILGRLAGHQKQYFDRLRLKCQNIDMKALSMLATGAITIDEGFVDIYLDTRIPRKTSINPVSGTLGYDKDENTVWDYLAASAFRNKHLLVIASAGRGKTTLLQHIVLTLVEKDSKYHSYWSNLSHKIPVFLSLRDVADGMSFRDPSKFSLEEILSAELDKGESNSPTIGSDSLSAWLIQQLNKGRCLVMLDGLDEIPDSDEEMHENMVKWIQEQVKEYGKNRFIVTSRPFGFSDTSLNNLEVLEIRLFNFTQIKSLVGKWCLAHESKNIKKKLHIIRKDAADKAADLLSQLRDHPNLLELAVNPLLLTMIVLVHMNGSVLPGSRAGLYADVCRVCFGKRREEQGHKLKLKPAQVEELLQPLAYYMMTKREATISFSEVENQIGQVLARYPDRISLDIFLRDVEKVSGLLLKQEQGQYKFAHQTFQEYLAAVFIHEQRMEHELVQQVKSQANLNWWKEIICLYCSIAEGTEIIRACLDAHPPSEEMLALAFDCLDMEGKLSPDIRQQLESLRNQGIVHTDPQTRQAMWGVSLRRRPAHMLRFNEEMYIDSTFVTCGEYQLFLNDRRAQGIFCQPDHWHTETFEWNLESAPVLGVRLSDARDFCRWLTARQGDHWSYRLPKVDERASIVALGSKLLPTAGYWVEDGLNFAWAERPQELPRDFLGNQWEDDHGPRSLSEQILQRARSLHPDTHLNLGRVLYWLEKFDSELNREFDKVIDRLSNLTYTGSDPIDVAFVRRIVIERLWSAYSSLSRRPARLVHSSPQKLAPKDIHARIDLYIDTYVSLAIVEARKEKRLHPCEGILLVRQGIASL